MSSYRMRVVIGQPECSYPGEFAPRVIAAFDEYTLEDAPDAVNEEIAKAEKTGFYTAIKCVEVVVDQDSIFGLFRTTEIKGVVTAV